MRDIDRILHASDSAEFLEEVTRLVEDDDVKIVLGYVRDTDDGGYDRQTLCLGDARGYEWLGIVEETKQGMLDIIYGEEEAHDEKEESQ